MLSVYQSAGQVAARRRPMPIDSSRPSHIVAGVGFVVAHDVREQIGGELGESIQHDCRGDNEARQDQ